MKRKPTVESAVSSINRRIRDITRTFGMFSLEYMEIKRIVEETYGRDSVLVSIKKNSPIQLLRTKTAIKGFQNTAKKVAELYSRLQENGTALQIARRQYDPTMTGKRLSQETNRVKSLASNRAMQSTVIETQYIAIESITDTATRERIRNRLTEQAGKSQSEREAIYNEAIADIETALKKQAENYVKSITSPGAESARQEHTDLSKALRR